jgi:hypothetical protein
LEAVITSETWADFSMTTQPINPEDSHIHRSQDLFSEKLILKCILKEEDGSEMFFVAENRNQWSPLVNKIMNFIFHKDREFLDGETINVLRRTLLP